MVDYLYGVEDSQARITGERDFTELFSRLLEGQSYAKYQPENEIIDHMSLYYQGTDGFLKLQVYDLPPNSGRIAARSVGNHTMPVYDQFSWVFTEDAKGFRQLFKSKEPSGGQWTIRDNINRLHIYVVALYDNASSCSYGSEQVWVQLAELGCRIKRLRIVFGGHFRDLSLNQAFLLRMPEQNFLELDEKSIRHFESPFNTSKTKFARFEKYATDEIGEVVTEIGQPPWERVIALWNELKSTPDVTLWDGVELNDIDSDVLVMANGHLALA
jgi:hypothetical protein